MAGWPVFQKIKPLSPEDWEAIRQEALNDTWEPYQEEVPSTDLLDFPRYVSVSNDDYDDDNYDNDYDDDEYDGYTLIS